MTAPTAEGGALRAQDLRTAGDPVGLSGTVIRVNPDTGLAMADNPNAGAADLNAQRIVAYGLRNPFRMTTRPGTDEVWIGDVGWATIEEIDRLVSPRAAVGNFGWPCYEGDARQSGYDAADLKICEDLYAQGVDTKPYFPYRHGQPLNANDNCNVARGSSTSGISFDFYSGGPYPAEYDGALFFSDYSRNCIWVMTKGTDGLPDRLKARPFVSDAAGPVDLQLSPQGELFYRRPQRRHDPPRRLRRCRPEYVPGRPVPGAVLPQHDPDRDGGLSALRTCAAEPRLGGRRSGRRRRRRVLGPLDRTDELPLEQHLHVHRRDRRRHAGVDRRPGPHRPVAQPAGHVHGVQGADGGQPRHTHRLFRRPTRARWRSSPGPAG